MLTFQQRRVKMLAKKAVRAFHDRKGSTAVKDKLKTPKNNLLMIAGIVWCIAGFNILRLGVIAYSGRCVWWRLLLSAAVFALFQYFVFGKMVRKHTRRITQYVEDRQYFYKFFDQKGFLIMAFMITFGIGLRASGLVPAAFIAVFYTGLGASLMTAGILFLVNYAKECAEAKHNSQ